MEGSGLLVGWVCLMCGYFCQPVMAQRIVRSDTSLVFDLQTLADPGETLITGKIFQDFEYSLALTNFFSFNREEIKNANFCSFLQQVHYQMTYSNIGNISFIQQINHRLGLQFFFDSITQFHTDENTLDTKLNFNLSRFHALYVSSNLTTRFFNGYHYAVSPSGGILRTLNSSFCTPLIITISTGYRFLWPDFASFNVGISSAKFTWIRDARIYEIQQISSFYGVPADKRYMFEYGLSFQILIDKEICKQVGWACDLLMFKNTRLPLDFSLKNLFRFRIHKFVQATLQTCLIYEEQVTTKLQIENFLTVGFSFQME